MIEDNSGIEAVPQKSNRRTMMIGGVSAILLGCCGLLFVLIIGVVLDPLDLNILSRLNGRYDAAATVMPADTAVYFGINILNVNQEGLARVTQPFLEIAGDPDIDNLDGAQEEFLSEIESDLQLSVENDIVPWIGQYVGFGITDMTLDGFGEIESIEWVLAIEARDKERADEFLVKFRDIQVEETGQSFSEQTYQDVVIYEMQEVGDFEQLVFGRSDNMVLMAANFRAVQAAIDAQNGDALDESEGYQQIVDDLPRSRALTVFTHGDELRALLERLEGASGVSAEVGSLPLLGYVSSATTFSIVEAGLQIDTVTYTDPDQLTTTQKAMFDAAGQPSSMIQLLPSQTVAYLTGQRLDLLWLTIREATGDEVSFDESMEGFGREVGLNPSTELFPLLNQDWAIALAPAQEGILAEQLEVPVSLLLIAGTDQPGPMAGTVDSLKESLEGQQLVVNPTSAGAVSGYEVSLGEEGSPAFYFGLEQSNFYLATSGSIVQDTFTVEGALAQSERYLTFQDDFSSDMNLAFFIDVRSLLGTIRESRSGFELEDFNESVEFFQPVEAIGIGNAYDGEIRRTQMIIFIETGS